MGIFKLLADEGFFHGAVHVCDAIDGAGGGRDAEGVRIKGRGGRMIVPAGAVRMAVFVTGMFVRMRRRTGAGGRGRFGAGHGGIMLPSAQGTQGRSCTHGYFSVFLRRHPQVFFPVVGYEATSRSSLFQDCRNGGEFLLFRLLCGTGNRRRICRVGLRAGFSSPGPRPVSARERALLVCTGKGPFRRVRTAGAFTFEKGKTRGAAQRRPVRTGWKNTLFP